jgi:hypothetical protein
MALLGQLRAWNCSLGTYDLQLRGYSAGGLKFGRACGRAAIAGPVPLRTERAFARARSVQCHRKALAQQLYTRFGTAGN